MKQAKRLFYIILLNIVISASTVLVVLNLWERNHPVMPAGGTPVILVVTPTHSVIIPVVSNQTGSKPTIPTDTGIIITGTPVAGPTVSFLAYQVKEGDTLGALAVEFNVSVEDIMTVNGLTDPNSIYLGQIIKIPTAPLPTITPTPTATAIVSPTPRPSLTATRGPTATFTSTPAGQEAQLVIETVIGAGVLANEHVVLQRTGEGELSLAGWHLLDGLGNTYTFPELTLYKGVSINLNTRQGEDTMLDLFWGLPTAVWNSGNTAYLYDAQGKLRDSYLIP